MQLLTLYVNGIRIILTVLAFYHFFRRDFKKLWAAVLVLALTFVLALIDKFFGLRADPVGNFLYITVIVMSLYLGSGLKYYDRWSWWDRLIHFLCGVMFVSFGIPLAAKMGIIGRMAVLFFCFTLSTALHGSPALAKARPDPQSSFTQKPAACGIGRYHERYYHLYGRHFGCLLGLVVSSGIN